MKFSFEKRLRDVEHTKGAREATLVFADSSTRAIRVRNRSQLKLCFDVFAKLRAYPPPVPEGIPQLSPPAEPRTASDRAIELLGNAESLDGPRFLQTIHEMCKTLKERKEKDAPTLHRNE